jgi:hypothetical protein
MGRPKFSRQQVEIRLRPEPEGRPRRLVPWWARALRRVWISRSLRRQGRGSLGRAHPWRDAGAELRAYARRSVVKASFSRNRKSGAWTAHARYLSRPGAQQELAKGLGFDASPEDADRLNLRDHVRALVGQMERDLGTKLEWAAIDHHNTDDAHVHLLVRGVREDGRPLEIDREYLRSGVRTRSQEIVARELGPRLEPEMLHARERVIRREQWTEIDRALQRKADANRIVNYEQFQPRSEAARVRAQQEVDRLQFLSGQGLARRIDERSWQLAEDHERQLRDRQRSIDVIKSRAHSRQRDIDSGFDRVRERERERNG